MAQFKETSGVIRVTDNNDFPRLAINADGSVITRDSTGENASLLGASTLPDVGPGATGPIGDSTHTPVITIDAKGRVTALTSAAISGGGSGSTPYIDAAADYGVTADGSTDDLAALQAACDAAIATGSSGAAGNLVLLPPGIIMLSDTLSITTSYCRLVGANDNATRIKATSGFATTTGKAVVQLGPHPSGNGDISGVTLENLRVDCANVASVGVNINDGNEHCALLNVEVRNFCLKGIYVTASNAVVLERIGAVGSTTAGTPLYPIHLDTNTGSIWLRDLSNLSCGNTSPAGSAGVRIDHTPGAYINGVHVEHCEDGVYFASGSGLGSCVNAYGHTSLTSMLHIDGGYGAGSSLIFYAAISSGGGTYSVKDYPNSRLYTGNVNLVVPVFTPAYTALPSSIGSADSTTSSTTIAMTVTDDVVVGDFIFVGGNWGGTSNTAVSVTDSQSNTYQIDVSISPSGSPGNLGGDACIASCKVSTALTANVDTITLTVTNNSSSKVIVAAKSSPLASSSWFDTSAFANTGSTSPFSSGTTSTRAQAAELLIGIQGNAANSDGCSATSPWVQVVRKTVPGSRQLQLAYQVVSSVGTDALTGTLTTDTNYVAAVATYKY